MIDPEHPREFINPRLGEARETLAHVLKAEIFLGWEPKISLEEGIEMLKVTERIKKAMRSMR